MRIWHLTAAVAIVALASALAAGLRLSYGLGTTGALVLGVLVAISGVVSGLGVRNCERVLRDFDRGRRQDMREWWRVWTVEMTLLILLGGCVLLLLDLASGR